MNRTSVLLAVLLGASVIVNVVLILRPSRAADDRPWATRPPSNDSYEPVPIPVPGPGPSVPPADREAELARLKRENDALKAANRESKTNSVATLQEEQERSVQYWQSVEAFSKVGRITDDPGAFHRVIQETGDYLELDADQRAKFTDTAQKGAVMIAQARQELEAIANPLKQAGLSPPDDPQWQQANQRMHIQIRQCVASLRTTLDRTRPRHNAFSAQMDRWVNVVNSPHRP